VRARPREAGGQKARRLRAPRARGALAAGDRRYRRRAGPHGAHPSFLRTPRNRGHARRRARPRARARELHQGGRGGMSGKSGRETLDKALKDAKKSFVPKEPDWDAVDAKLFARIEAADRAESDARVGRVGRAPRAWGYVAGALAVAAAAAVV